MGKDKFEGKTVISLHERPLAATIALAARLLACAAVVTPLVGGQPIVTLNPPTSGATQLSGKAYNIDTSTTKVVIYALTNEFYVQPFAAAPFTGIVTDGSWTSFTNSWSGLVVLLVDPATYTPAATEITNPALDPGVLAWTEYPSAAVSVDFSGRTWGIKVTGNVQGDQFDPGPNFWSSDPSVVSVANDGLHLKIQQINGMWQSGEVYLLIRVRLERNLQPGCTRSRGAAPARRGSTRRRTREPLPRTRTAAGAAVRFSPSGAAGIRAAAGTRPATA
jgi:hypothetical protein